MLVVYVNNSFHRRPILTLLQTQSTRGENQNRPTSSGGYAAGGAVGGSNASNASAGGDFPEGGSGSLLSPTQGMGGADADTAAYGYGGGVSTGHNGISGTGY